MAHEHVLHCPIHGLVLWVNRGRRFVCHEMDDIGEVEELLHTRRRVLQELVAGSRKPLAPDWFDEGKRFVAGAC